MNNVMLDLYLVVFTAGKTLSNTFVFTAKTATSVKKSQFNVKESLKKRPTYKPHTGMCSNFNIGDLGFWEAKKKKKKGTYGKFTTLW